METGPNDVRRVFWALGELFFLFFCFFLILTKSLLYLITKSVMDWAGSMKTGPNDVFGIVQAIGESFLILFRFYIYSNWCSICNLWSTGTGTSASMRTGPNDTRCIVWALGVFSFYLFHVFIPAQTTPDASFGPKWVFSISFMFFKNTNYCFIVYSMYTTRKIRQGRRKWVPNDASGIIWALGEFFLFFSPCIIAYIMYYYQKVSKYVFCYFLSAGQGHLSWPDPEGARSRASKNGLALPWPGPWTVYQVQDGQKWKRK